MECRPNNIQEIMTELVSIPSVTGTREEAHAANWIRDRLAQIPWFQDNPDCLQRFSVKLPESDIPMEAVFAMVQARETTSKTLLFIGHFDVVDTNVYGGLRHLAYRPGELQQALSERPLSREARADLESGKFVFGRGVMDMKAGVAIEMDLLEEFAYRRDLYDINVAILLVGDEEGNNGGMRAAVPFLGEICTKTGLDIEAVINTEPSDAGLPGNTKPVIFSGTMGKVMPFFYVLGRPTHVGNYFQGISSALLISRIISLVEANPSLADTAHGEVAVPPICLAQGTREREYSVTVPDRAYSYFNYVTVGKTPGKILEEMQSAAIMAAEQSIEHLEKSHGALNQKGYSGEGLTDLNVPVVLFEKLETIARENPEYGPEMKHFLEGLASGLDLREKGILMVEKTLELAGSTGPLIVVGMLPPFLPQRTSLGNSPKEKDLQKAIGKMKLLAREKYNIQFQDAVFFAGLCDLSYVGSDMGENDLEVIAANTPGWNSLYSVPLKAMRALNCPIVNIGPEGRDAHKMTERLETEYSFRILPNLLRELLRSYDK